MTDHVRMAIYSIKQGTYQELMEKAREGPLGGAPPVA
jgi:hypothetical protein